MKYILVQTGWCPELKQNVPTFYIICVGCPSQSRVPPSCGYPDLFRQSGERIQICARALQEWTTFRQAVVFILLLEPEHKDEDIFGYIKPFRLSIQVLLFLPKYFVHHFIHYIKRLDKSEYIINEWLDISCNKGPHNTYYDFMKYL